MQTPGSFASVFVVAPRRAGSAPHQHYGLVQTDTQSDEGTRTPRGAGKSRATENGLNEGRGTGADAHYG